MEITLPTIEQIAHGKLKTTSGAKPSSTKATTPGDPPPVAKVELDLPPTVNGRPTTALPHMPANYRY